MSTLNNPRSSFDWCAREDYPKRPAQLKGPHRVQNSTKQPPTAPDTQKTALAAHVAWPAAHHLPWTLNSNVQSLSIIILPIILGDVENQR